MPFPAGAITITVTGTFPVPVAGTARAGQVVFTPSAVLVDSTQHAIYSGGGPVDLDASGHFSTTLLCTDDTDVQPTGWRWRVDEQPTGGQRRTYWIALPSTLGATVDLSQLAPVSAPDGSGQTPSGGGPSPSSTVTGATSYGQVPNAGTASAYSRGDHTHGTPTLPSASTSAAGVVQLDGTAGDIQALGTQAAGATGKAADGGHVHPTTGLVLTSGDQVINGEKTFNNAIPVLPGFDAAFANQAIRKAQLDAAIAGVSGGGASIRTATARIVDGAVVDLASASSWTIATTSVGTPLQCSIAASAGDRIRVEGDFMRAGAHFLDWVLLDNAGAIAVYGTTRTSTAPTEGSPSMYPSLSFSYVQGAKQFTVSSGHIASGQVTIALAHQGTGSGKVYANSTYPFELLLTNLGPEPA